jgi:hypothetical protein
LLKIILPLKVRFLNQKLTFFSFFKQTVTRNVGKVHLHQLVYAHQPTYISGSLSR